MLGQPSSGHGTRPEDLTARARIRNAALELYSRLGEERVSMRTVAAEAGVTVGLIQHHFGNKDGLRAAVDEFVVEHVVEALERAEQDGAREGECLVSARNRAVRDMYADHPAVAHYVRRALIDPTTRGAPLLGRLVALIEDELTGLRAAGHASTDRPMSAQALRMALGQVGEIVINPLVDALWRELDGDVTRRPRVRIVVEEG